MSLETDAEVVSVDLYFIPITTRTPLKFGAETLTEVTCARAKVTVRDRTGREAMGWGETPLSVQWVWPSKAPYEPRHQALKSFCLELAKAWTTDSGQGHPIEITADFIKGPLTDLHQKLNARPERQDAPMSWLAALVCCSVFDQALHDAYGHLVEKPIYQTYNKIYMNRDLSSFLEPAADCKVSFKNQYPSHYLAATPPRRLPAWHLVGGLDAISESDLSGTEPEDGHPHVLRDWIRRDGLTCLKIKLRGNDAAWDLKRLVDIGQIAIEENVDWLTTDFNCTVDDPAYVNTILDQIRDDHPRLYGMILYVEQPFPYELEESPIDTHSVSARKPLFLDESAHDWELIRLGRSLGWTGVALKTCKTQTGAILSACWAKAHGMTLMVQDLTNPMLAQIPHLQLAAHTGTIMGVETNGMQFYPAASEPEAAVHPGLYQRRQGCVDLSSLRGPGFGFRIDEIDRKLPSPVIST